MFNQVSLRFAGVKNFLRGNTMRIFLSFLICIFFADNSNLADEPLQKPNVVIILADDLALMDLGVYGGEASTPYIDALASKGAMFIQYRTSPLCSPSRAMLLTGIDNHRTGVATIPEVLPKEHEGKPGYSMSFEPNVYTIADRLRSIGYRTLMTGKWHLGEYAHEMPQEHGFDRSFALAASGADNWEDKSYIPYYQDAPWFEDGLETDLPDDFYSSKFIVDKMIEYIENTDSSRPFLAYLPFQAIHIPVQAPADFIKKYEGFYDEGWDELRQKRFNRAQEIGLIKKGVPLAPMPEGSRQWRNLNKEDKLLYARRMEVNAAMIEAMDFHIGRFVEYLKSEGEYENTIFVFASDNGPEPNRGDHDWRLTSWMGTKGYHIGLEGLGGRGSWGFIGPEWATAAASPGALFKFYATEGGIRAPLIVSGPGIEPTKIQSPAMVTDITPTILDWLEVPELAEPAKAITGRSLLPVLKGQQNSAYGHDEVRAIEVSGNSALYKGDYKITRSMPPVGDGRWRLFNMSTDPGETKDISFENENVFKELLREYGRYATEMGVLDMPPGFNSIVQIDKNSTERWLRHNLVFLVLLGLFVLALFWGICWLVGAIVKLVWSR